MIANVPGVLAKLKLDTHPAGLYMFILLTHPVTLPANLRNSLTTV